MSKIDICKGLKKYNMFKTGIGIDYHKLANGLKLYIGGVEIPHTKGAVAHSDGDVLLHAICDAMLGALALGDIGKHFPNTDQDLQGIDSKILLKKTMQIVAGNGYKVVNVDGSVCLEKPKIMKYSGQMKEAIAGILNITVSEVSIKATTTEELGFAGREEGLFALASVLLQKNTGTAVRVVNKGEQEIPQYATIGSSGLDVRANINEPLILQPMERSLVPTGLYFEIPEGFEIQVRPRSGLASKQGITCLNTPGTIDADYRGELKVLLINLDKNQQTILPGDRIAQLVLASVEKLQWHQVNELSETTRGDGGFGHTGKQ